MFREDAKPVFAGDYLELVVADALRRKGGIYMVFGIAIVQYADLQSCKWA